MTKAYYRPDPSPSPNAEPFKILLRDGKVAINENCCCNCGCFLPYTTTVTFDELVNKIHSFHCPLTITSNFGSGAYAVGMSPGGCGDGEFASCGPSDRGPLTEVLLVNKGEGYALIGRSEPTLSVSGSGHNAVFTPVLVEDNTLGCPTWSIESISVTGGTGYQDGELLKIKASVGDTTVAKAIAVLHTNVNFVEPTVTVTLDGGEGAQFDVTLVNTNPPNYTITDIDVSDGGTDYFQRYPLVGTISYLDINTPDTEITPASAFAYPEVVVPTKFVSEHSAGGINYDIELIFEQITETYIAGNTNFTDICWHVTDVNIINGGTNSSVNDYVVMWAEDSEAIFNICNLRIAEVDENGSILSIEVLYDGRWRECPQGSVGGVHILNGGAYRKEIGGGVPESVEIIDPGKYYRNDINLPPCVANVNVIPCGGGVGAIIEAIIDEDPNSETFGQIIDLNIVDGGEHYLVWHWICGPYSELNGKPFVLRASDPRRLVHIVIESCFDYGVPTRAFINNLGPRIEPTIKITGECPNGDPKITHTLAKNDSNECEPYWYIDSVNVEFIGAGCPETQQASIVDYPPSGCALTVLEDADIVLTSDEEGHIANATINSGGKYYKQLEWDGQPSSINSISLVQGTPGNIYAARQRKKPEKSDLIFTVDGPGNGIEFDFELVEYKDKNNCNLPYWGVENITVSGDASGYNNCSVVNLSTNNPNIMIDLTPDEPLLSNTQSIGYIITRTEPTITASINDPEGSGVELTVELSQEGFGCDTWWSISKISGCGGKDYTEDATVDIDYGDAIEIKPAIFSIQIIKGKIICINILDRGQYYLNNNIPNSIFSTTFGAINRVYEDRYDVPGIVDINVKVIQEPESNGSGAVIEAEVDDDPNSESFGTITKLQIVECGENYTLFGGPLDCKYYGGCQDDCSIRTIHYGDPVKNITMTMPNKKNQPINLFYNDKSDIDYDIDTDNALPVKIHFRSDIIEDCNHPIPSPSGSVIANVLYGSPSGIVTIERGGLWDSTGTDNCPECYCPVDNEYPYINPETIVSITSNIPCGNDEFYSYDGNWGNINFASCQWVDPITGDTYFVDLEISMYCCPFKCEDDGGCNVQTGVRLVGTIYTSDNGAIVGKTIDTGDGTSGGPCTGNITFENGCPTGSITVEFELGTLFMTVNFGGCP